MEYRVLRQCLTSDLEALRQISVETFTESFAAQNDPTDFQDYLQKAFSFQQLESEFLNPESRFYFLLLNGQLAGYVKLNEGEAQTEHWNLEAVEIERIYIRSAFQGKGLGSWMIRQLAEQAKASGKRFLWLGVWEENPDAIRFYERHGFTTFGKHPYYIGTDRQMDWMMRLELPS